MPRGNGSAIHLRVILVVQGLLNGKERVDAPPQINPFAKAQREAKPEKQTDLIGALRWRNPAGKLEHY